MNISHSHDSAIDRAVSLVQGLTAADALRKDGDDAYLGMATSLHNTIAGGLARLHEERANDLSLDDAPADATATVRQWAGGWAEVMGRFLVRITNTTDTRSYCQRYELLTHILGALHPVVGGRVEDQDDLDIFFPPILEQAASRMEDYYSVLLDSPNLGSAGVQRVRGFLLARRSVLRGMLRERVLLNEARLGRDENESLAHRIHVATDSALAAADRQELDHFAADTLRRWIAAHTAMHQWWVREAVTASSGAPLRVYGQTFASELVWGNPAVQQVLGADQD